MVAHARRPPYSSKRRPVTTYSMRYAPPVGRILGRVRRATRTMTDIGSRDDIARHF